jgi:NAD(P)-dependent dehydrogenase (short-subunit alcohol dehydrogenase family)
MRNAKCEIRKPDFELRTSPFRISNFAFRISLFLPLLCSREDTTSAWAHFASQPSTEDRQMEVKDKVAIVTGGANGIGRALCRRLATGGARGVVVADLDDRGATQVAGEIGGLAVTVDVSVEAELVRLVEEATARFGPVDLFCSNAGIGLNGGPEVSDADWERIWKINVMSHVYAARAVLPDMLKRGEGYLLNTASAAGLLTQIGSAPYAVTKHAAVAFAEWLAVTYGDAGIRVSCLCPQGVRTNMLREAEESGTGFLSEGALDPEEVAEIVIAGLRQERFLILPHPEVAEYMRRKAGDYDRWLRGMRRLQSKVQGPA